MFRSYMALAAAGLIGACATGGEPSAEIAQSALDGPNCPNQSVIGYYAGYYAFHPDYQKPQHVDMTAMTHLVFGRIYPGGANFGNPDYDAEEVTQPGKVVIDNMDALTKRSLGPGAPSRTIEEYMIARAHQVGTKALVMLGGNKDGAGFRASLAPAVRPTFINNVLAYMVSRDYDGIEVDFEGFLSATDQALLEAFVVELRAEANKLARYKLPNKPVIIIYPGGLKNMNPYANDPVTPHDVRMVDLVDQYNLMSYGAGWYGEDWHTTTHSPLTGAVPHREMSIASTINALVGQGASRCKIGMGIGFYGMMYKPPFTAPGQNTAISEPPDFSLWSTDDNIWNFAQLTKKGYLNNGTEIWDPLTQTTYRTYGSGGYTAPGATHPVGYISYEDVAGIQAKGRWSRSNKPDEGAAGTIIWLVNYGTTNGVNNPLLTAVKRHFLDPNATEPGPDPNPGTLPALPAAAEPVPGDGSGGDGTGLPPRGSIPPPPPVVTPSDISHTITVTSSWNTGYCANVRVTNNGTATGTWAEEVPFTDTVTGMWGALYVITPGTLRIRGAHWQRILEPGQSYTVGLCASFATTTPPPSGPPNLVGAVTIINSWSTGWCANAVIQNTGTGPATAWSFTLPKPAAGTLFSSAYPYTQTATHVTFSGGNGNPVLDAGETATIQICASVP